MGRDRWAVVAEETSVDTDDRADEAWALGIQLRLDRWSRIIPTTAIASCGTGLLVKAKINLSGAGRLIRTRRWRSVTMKE